MLTARASVTSAILSNLMSSEFNGTDAQNRWQWKDAYEALEVGLVLYLRQHGKAFLAGDRRLALLRLADLQAKLPTHTRRSEDSYLYQQFSTPLPMGYAVSRAAQLRSGDTVLEPSAGNGLLAIFAEHGFALKGVTDIAPHLVPGAGVYAGAVTPQDEKDAARAEAIVAALGAVDVGQGCVVAGGLCLAVETLPGTDAMLGFVAQIPAALRPAKGLFYKAPKPGQDRRIDLPALGVQTVRNAAAAGLGGIVWQAGGVICLDLPAMQQEAEALGLFLWAR